MNPGAFHEPVLVKEVIEHLSPKPGDVIVDCNLGHGGHALEILKHLRGEGLLVGIDLQAPAVETARRRILAVHSNPSCYKLIVGNHADLPQLLLQAQVPPPQGILLDLGPSTPQLLDPRLGMSWESEEALDMRLDPQAGNPSASEIVNEWSEAELARLIYENSEEKWSRRIARRIVEARTAGPITTGKQLGRIVGEAIPRKAWPPKTHPATRVFLALRIAANREYENLEAVLPLALEALAPGGRLVVISFHGGEDGRVKRFMQKFSRPETEVPWPLPQGGHEGNPRLRLLNSRPVTATKEEIERNPRSRSAKLRAAVKLR